MTPKEFILEVDDKIEEAVSYGYPIHIDTEEALFWWMEQYADYKVDLARNKHGNFTNGTFTLSWKDEDYVKVQNNRIGNGNFVRRRIAVFEKSCE